jgi:molybdopterin synthase sulfur carrier subunit
MADSTITVTLKLFAAYQEAVGTGEMVLTLPVASPVQVVCDRILADYPQLATWRDRTRFGVNLNVVSPDTPLQDGDEVVLIPPVSGG